ncbi:hypothetical protein XAB3213_2880011 [Xanthomonas citri pv. bilvae]|nr:hypothetical protein XAB3213_2880011 [Xanthomonas citri pv. bilvae]
MQRSARRIASTSQRADLLRLESKYAGKEGPQWRHLKDVEAELARLKRMYAELALIITRSRTFCRERLSQTSRLQLGMAMQTAKGLSARRADRVLQQSRTARHYCPRQRDDGPLIAQSKAAIQAHLKDNPDTVAR